jgi:hypothetical protein
MIEQCERVRFHPSRSGSGFGWRLLRDLTQSWSIDAVQI